MTTPVAMPEDGAKEFENLIVFSNRFEAMLKASRIFDDTGLSITTFSVLSTVAVDTDLPAHKVFLKASIIDKVVQREIRKELVADGLLIERASDGGKKVLEITEKGRLAVQGVRSRLTEIVAQADVKSWKAVPRLASIVRTLRPAMSPTLVND